MPDGLNRHPAAAGRKHPQDADRASIGAALRKDYEDGAGIGALAAANGWSDVQVRSLLLEAGTTLRGPGRPKGSTSSTNATGRYPSVSAAQ